MKILHNKVPMTKKRRMAVHSALCYAKALHIANYDCEVTIAFKYAYQKTFGIMACVDYHSHNKMTIEIDADLRREVMCTIMAHEMVHIKQYLRGQLAQSSDNLQLWKGEPVEGSMPYHRTPWEIEAYSKQTVLYYDFIYNHGNDV